VQLTWSPRCRRYNRRTSPWSPLALKEMREAQRKDDCLLQRLLGIIEAGDTID
jgi:hypothetical protein